jgi:hypothetical protein
VLIKYVFQQSLENHTNIIHMQQRTNFKCNRCSVTCVSKYNFHRHCRKVHKLNNGQLPDIFSGILNVPTPTITTLTPSQVVEEVTGTDVVWTTEKFYQIPTDNFCAINGCQTRCLTKDSLLHHREVVHKNTLVEEKWLNDSMPCEFCKKYILYTDIESHTLKCSPINIYSE